MKRSTRTIALAAALLCACAHAQADSGVVWIDTPQSQYTFAACSFEAVNIGRYGTTLTAITDCAIEYSVPQTNKWLPAEHPDGGIFRWEGRIRVNGSHSLFEQCELVDYDSEHDHLKAECLDDPFAK